MVQAGQAEEQAGRMVVVAAGGQTSRQAAPVAACRARAASLTTPASSARPPSCPLYDPPQTHARTCGTPSWPAKMRAAKESARPA